MRFPQMRWSAGRVGTNPWSRLLPALLALPLLGGCCHTYPGGGTTVNLEPNDPRPIVSVNVSDADEAELLVWKFNLEVVRAERGALYFFDQPSLHPQLVDLGYEVEPHNAYEVYRRVVLVEGQITDKDLDAANVQLLNRERTGLIVDGSLAGLRALQRGGFRLVPVRDPEPRPRQIRVLVDSTDDVRRIGALGVDIHSAKPERPADPDDYDERPIEIFGGAFDGQIEQIEAAGYEVERLPEPPAGGSR